MPCGRDGFLHRRGAAERGHAVLLSQPLDAVFSRYIQQRYQDLIFRDETCHLSEAE